MNLMGRSLSSSFSVLVCLSACGGGDDPQPDLTTRVCTTVCDKVASCAAAIPGCETDCDGTVRPLVEVDAGVSCASDAEINACVTAFENASCLSFLLPNPVPEACNLCGIDFEEILMMMNQDGGVDGGTDAGEEDAATDAEVDAGEEDAGVDAGEEDAGVDAGQGLPPIDASLPPA